jgi:putative addiction module component (TIGR02574 family)
MSIETVLSQVEELSLEERAELVRRIEAGMIQAGWDPDCELSDEVKAMLDERIRWSDANPGAGVPLDEVVAGARERYEARKRAES